MADFWKGFSGGFNAMQGHHNARALKEEREADRLYREQAFAEQQRQFEIQSARANEQLGLQKNTDARQAAAHELEMSEVNRKVGLRTKLDSDRAEFGQSIDAAPRTPEGPMQPGESRFDIAPLAEMYHQKKREYAGTEIEPHAKTTLDAMKNDAIRQHLAAQGYEPGTVEYLKEKATAKMLFEDMDAEKAQNIQAVHAEIERSNMREGVAAAKRGDAGKMQEIFDATPLFGNGVFSNPRKTKVDAGNGHMVPAFEYDFTPEGGQPTTVNSLELEEMLMDHDTRMEFLKNLNAGYKDSPLSIQDKAAADIYKDPVIEPKQGPERMEGLRASMRGNRPSGGAPPRAMPVSEFRKMQPDATDADIKAGIAEGYLVPDPPAATPAQRYGLGRRENEEAARQHAPPGGLTGWLLPQSRY